MFSKALGKREISIVRVIGTTLLILICTANCGGGGASSPPSVEGEETIGKKPPMNINSRWRSNFNLQGDLKQEQEQEQPAPHDNRTPHRGREPGNKKHRDGQFEYSLSKEEILNMLESRDFNHFDESMCHNRYPSVESKVSAYLPIVEMIVHTATASEGSFKGKTYKELAWFLDTFGPRLSGSDALEDSIDFLKAQLEASRLERVWTEDVRVPQWKRGEERAQIIKPRRKSLALFGLGETVSTSPDGITAHVVVFDSYHDLLNENTQLSGKIVVCNYGGPEEDTLSTIDNGYAKIADAGAVAVLYKSAATFSMYSVHARRGNLYYSGASKLIPIAYITIEDAEYLSRIYNRGEEIEIFLKMLDTNGNSTSRNLFAELKGSSTPEEIVIVSAHTDSWDAGQGAHDDGIGIYLMLETLKMLEFLDLRPKRSVQGALWTAEEYGYNGSLAYIQTHKEDLDKLRVVLEADYACLAPVGLAFNRDYGAGRKIGSESSRSTSNKVAPSPAVRIENSELGCILYYILQLLGDTISQRALVQTDIFRTDLDHFQDVEIPVVSLLGDDGRYFWFHHTDADTVTALEEDQLDFCLAIWTATTYILADIDKLSDSSTSSSNSYQQQHKLPQLTLLITLYTITLSIFYSLKMN